MPQNLRGLKYYKIFNLVKLNWYDKLDKLNPRQCHITYTWPTKQIKKTIQHKLTKWPKDYVFEQDLKNAPATIYPALSLTRINESRAEDDIDAFFFFFVFYIFAVRAMLQGLQQLNISTLQISRLHLSCFKRFYHFTFISQIAKTTCLYHQVKGCPMGRSDKVSLWYVALLINTRFRLFISEQAIVKRI